MLQCQWETRGHILAGLPRKPASDMQPAVSCARLYPGPFWQHGARSKVLLLEETFWDCLKFTKCRILSRIHFISSLAIELAPNCDEVIVTV